MYVPNLVNRINLCLLYGKLTGPVMKRCPFHNDKEEGKPNYAVYPHNAVCFKCGKTEGALQYIMRIKDCTMKEAMDIYVPQILMGENGLAQEEPKVKPLESRIVKVYADNLQVNPFRQSWLLDRGITQDTMKEAQLGLSGNTYTIPVFGLDNVLYNIRYRITPERETPNMPKYWGTRGHNQAYWYFTPGLRGNTLEEAILSTGKAYPNVVVTEGELDSLIMYQLGFAAVSVTNGSKSHADVNMFKNCNVYLFMDTDDAGRSGSRRLWRRLKEAGINVYRCTWDSLLGKDVTELWRNGIRRDFFVAKATEARIRNLGGTSEG